MLSEKIQDAMNEQINAELFSSYLYLSMSAYFEAQNFTGMARWMRVQAQEEVVHAMKFFDFINERGGRVVLDTIETPQTEWESPTIAFEAAYAHEQKVTRLINDLVDVAESERDRASMNFLQWYVDEQVEEEASVDEIVNKLKMFGSAPQALYMIDRELQQRSFAAPSASEEEGE